MNFNAPGDVVTVDRLSVSFPGCDALKQVSLSVPAGSIFALLGENGAGKTTLIRVLTGFLTPQQGSCQVVGFNPVKDALQIRGRIGYVSDAPALYDWMRVDEIGWFTASFYEAGFIERYRELIRHYQLPESRKIKVLSKGQRAKVALSLALAHDPALLILDEPTSGLDPLVRREFLESMLDRAATGRTVLLSSHQIAEVERVADEIAILHQGSICLEGSLNQLRQDTQDVVVTLFDSLIRLPELPESARIMTQAFDGCQCRMVVQHFDDEAADVLRQSPYVKSVQYRNANLEEIFTASVQQASHRKQNVSPRYPAEMAMRSI